jgi:hypothetical protein
MALIGHPLAQFDGDRLHEIVRGQIRVILTNENCHGRGERHDRRLNPALLPMRNARLWSPVRRRVVVTCGQPTTWRLLASGQSDPRCFEGLSARRTSPSRILRNLFRERADFIRATRGAGRSDGEFGRHATSSLWNDFREATVHRDRNAKRAVTTVADRICKCILNCSVSAMRVHQHGDDHAHCDSRFSLLIGLWEVVRPTRRFDSAE